MASDTAPRPCPSWCTGEHSPPEFPDDGFQHEALEITMTAAHGPDTEEMVPLQISLKSWVPLLTAEPLPPVIEVSTDRAPGPQLTPAEARQLAGILLRLSAEADAR